MKPKGQSRFLTVLNRETGEIIDRARVGGSRYGNAWVSLPQESAIELASDLTGGQVRCLLYMLGHMEFGNHIHVSRKDMSEHLGMVKESITTAMTGLVKHNVLAVEEMIGSSRLFRLNPLYGHKGRDVFRTVKEYEDLLKYNESYGVKGK